MLRKTLLICATLIGLLLGVGFLLPSDPNVERSIVIDAPHTAIYPTIATLKTWPYWTAWSREQDPDCKWSFEGPDTGAGAVMKWDGKTHMKGTLSIDTADPATGVEYTLQLEDMKPVKGSLTLAAEGAATKVTWRYHGKSDGMPWSNWMKLLVIEPIIGRSFDTGLTGLKTRIEAAPVRKEDGRAVEASAGKDKKQDTKKE